MKKILIIAFIMCFIVAKPQAVLEHVYSNQSCIFNLITPVWNLNTYGWVYAMKASNNQVSIYNSSHNLIKTIQLQVPSGVTSIYFSNISDKLFNSDNKIEILFGYMNPNAPYDIKMILQNEDGQVLQEFPNLYTAYIYAINGDFKMSAANSTDNSNYIYNLPGTLPVSVLDEFPSITNIPPFPNPTNTCIVIPLSLSENESTILNILNQNGQVIDSKKIKGFEKSIRYDVEGLNPGLYFYQYNNVKEKFIVTK